MEKTAPSAKTEDGKSGKPTPRVAVVGADGKPLMPTTPQRARRLLEEGLAEKRWNKLGQFYIQMQRPVGTEKQQLCLAVDPGSKFDGIAVLSKKQVLTCAMLLLPTRIPGRLQFRRQVRRARRYRNTRRRPARFDNRRKPAGWIAPSQKAKVDFRTRIVDEHCRIYPISQFAVEDVHFSPLGRRCNKYTSTVETGKAEFYRHLRPLGTLILYDGFETAEFRRRLGLNKSSRKGDLTWDTHAIDAIAIGCYDIGCTNPQPPEFWTWRRYAYPRRQLYYYNTIRGGIRVRYGGSWSLPPFKKGDVVQYRGEIVRVGGYKKGLISLHRFDLLGERITLAGKSGECKRLFNQRIFGQRKRL